MYTITVLGGFISGSIKTFLFFSAKDIVHSSYGGRFEIVSGFDAKSSSHTGIVKDKESGVEYFASIDSSDTLVIGAVVLPAPAIIRPPT